MQDNQQPPNILIAAFDGHIFGMNPATGGVIWEQEVPGAYTRLYINEAYTLALSGGALLCLETKTGRVYWKAEAYGETLLFPGGPFVFVGSHGEVQCHSIVDGRRLWREAFKGKGTTVVALGVPGLIAQLDAH